MSAAYDELIEHLQAIHALDEAASLLRWDQETYMPEGGTEARAHQLAVLDTLSHERFTADRVGHLLDLAEGQVERPEQEAQLREVRWSYERKVRVPSELVEALSDATSRALPAWVKAREKSDFQAFAPHLQDILELQREMAEAIDPARDAYEVLYEAYEPWIPLEEAVEAISGLRDGLLGLIDAAPEPIERQALAGTWPIDGQKQLCRQVLEVLGYDTHRGRLDESAHPFSTGNRYDARITTRFDEGDLPSALTSTIHEFGHALYTQGLPEAHYGTPLGESRNLVVHESQSRLWENHVGRSRAFWEHLVPLLGDRFPSRAEAIDPEQAWREVNVVQPSPIRVEADELTYHLHISLRLTIERELVSGALEVDEAPGRWDELMEQNLGIRPADDAQGILQDVHWSHGAFGYFPTYSLGSMLAAQLFATYEDERGPAAPRIARGEHGDLAGWLAETIHRHGRRYTTTQLIERATGSSLGPQAFLSYAKRKFGALWGTEP